MADSAVLRLVTALDNCCTCAVAAVHEAVAAMGAAPAAEAAAPKATVPLTARGRARARER
jgi:hypothetical protein